MLEYVKNEAEFDPDIVFEGFYVILCVFDDFHLYHFYNFSHNSYVEGFLFSRP